MILLTINSAMAADFNPRGNITGRDIYSIINMVDVCSTAGQCLSNVTGSGGGGGNNAPSINNSMWNLSSSNLYPSDLSYNVGIGTSTPSLPLVVQNGARFQGSSGLWTTGNFRKTMEFSKDSGILWNGDGVSNTFGLVQGNNDLTLSYAADDSASTTRNVIWTARSALGRLDVEKLLYMTANSYAIKASADTYHLLGRSTSGNQFGSLRYDNANDYVALGMNFEDTLTVQVDKQVGINDITPDAELDIGITDSTDVGLIVQGAASQTANLQEWHDSSSTVLSVVDETGKIGIGTDSPSYEISIVDNVGSAIGISVYNANTNPAASARFDFGRTTSASAAFIYSGNTDIAEFVTNTAAAGVRLRTTTSAQDIIFSPGNSEHARFDGSNGRLGLEVTAPSAQLHIKPATNTDKGLIVQGESSQTANLQEWQNSSGSTKSYVDKAGVFVMSECTGNEPEGGICYNSTAKNMYFHNSTSLVAMS